MKPTTVRELILLTTVVALLVPYCLSFFERSPARIGCYISNHNIESWVRSADGEIKPVTMREATLPSDGQRKGAQVDFVFASKDAKLEQFTEEISSQLRHSFDKDGLTIAGEWGTSDFLAFKLSGGSSQHFVTVHTVELPNSGEEAWPKYQVSCLTLTE